MKIKVNDIPREGLTIYLEYSGEILRDIIPINGPILINLRAERSGRDVRVKGDIKAKLILSCSRCLEDFEWEVKDKFDFLLVLPCSEDYPEVELSLEDMDISFFDGETVDVAQIAAEQIFLQVPIKPLCQETCKGLCPGCGTNLNINSCSCQPEEVSSPFKILKKYKF